MFQVTQDRYIPILGFNHQNLEEKLQENSSSLVSLPIMITKIMMEKKTLTINVQFVVIFPFLVQKSFIRK